jgi:plasmid stabilization system protein ParE
MAYKIRPLESALEDMDSIITYLSQFYPNTPKKFKTALKRRFATLRRMPRLYPVYPDKPAYRKMLVNEYLVFYKIDEEDKCIEIHRILHSSRDINQHLPD